MFFTPIFRFYKPVPLLWLTTICLLTACQPSEKTGDPELAQSALKEAEPKPGEPVRVSLTQAQYDVAGIRLGQPTERTMSTVLTVNGVLDVPAQNQVSVSVPFGGYIRTIDLEPGMRIRKGQTLVVLENPDYIQLQQDYLDTKAKLDYADLDFARQQELSRDNVNALKVFQQTRATRQSLQAQLAGMTQKLALLHIDPIKLTPATLTRTIRVPSPVSGYITDIPVNNGRYLNPADVLVQISDLSHPHVRLSVFEKDINRIRLGQIAQFTVSGSATQHRGDVFLIGKSISPDRTISVLVHPDGPPDQYIPGSYISARVELKNQPMIALPEAAVVSFGGKNYVYVSTAKSGNPTVYEFKQVEMKPGIRENGYVAVTLPPDVDPAKTPVVLTGAYSLLAKLNNSEEEE